MLSSEAIRFPPFHPPDVCFLLMLQPQTRETLARQHSGPQAADVDLLLMFMIRGIQKMGQTLQTGPASALDGLDVQILDHQNT